MLGNIPQNQHFLAVSELGPQEKVLEVTHQQHEVTHAHSPRWLSCLPIFLNIYLECMGCNKPDLASPHLWIFYRLQQLNSC